MPQLTSNEQSIDATPFENGAEFDLHKSSDTLMSYEQLERSKYVSAETERALGIAGATAEQLTRAEDDGYAITDTTARPEAVEQRDTLSPAAIGKNLSFARKSKVASQNQKAA